MGCAASRGVNPIDAALMQALLEARRRKTVHELTFNELLLKFPKVFTIKFQLHFNGAGNSRRWHNLHFALLHACADVCWFYQSPQMLSATGLKR